MNFTGSNVLVTGASRGIGAEIAKNLASYGLKVWINYRSGADAAEKIKEEIEAAGGKAAIIKADVTNEEEFVAAIKTIVDADGEISYLVNNAGITKDKLALRMSVEDFNDVISANLTSTFIGCKASLKFMGKKRFGSIVNISSIVGEMGNPGQTNYAASKGGVNAMTNSTTSSESAPKSSINFESSFTSAASQSNCSTTTSITSSNNAIFNSFYKIVCVL